MTLCKDCAADASIVCATLTTAYWKSQSLQHQNHTASPAGLLLMIASACCIYRISAVLYAGRYQPGSYYGAERGEYLPESWAKLVTYRSVIYVHSLTATQ
jgi:hypothetical protein